MAKSTHSDYLSFKADTIKEKSYLTKNVTTSIKILESPENNIVLEALLFLSKFADLKKTNLTYLQKNGLIPQIFKLFDKNICILRLSLRLLQELVTIEESINELDDEQYDQDIVKITDMFLNHSDSYVKEFCVDILAKISTSSRIAILVFKVDLFNPICEVLRNTPANMSYLESALSLFYSLLDAPGALSSLPENKIFSPILLLNYLNTEKFPNYVVNMVLEILRKLTYFCIEAIQTIFRECKLMETMLRMLISNNLKDYHEKVLSILLNCMESEETSSYFVETIEFLNFCQWLNTCDQEYLLSCITILERLTKIVSLRQTLFDLSVEETILQCLRSTEKAVLNKTCETVINMSTHKYCCDRMITPVVIKELISMLYRQDIEIDPNNEVALKTIYYLAIRNYKTLDLFITYEGDKILLKYFKMGPEILPVEAFLYVMQILDLLVVQPQYGTRILTDPFIIDILNHFQNQNDSIAQISLEIMSNSVTSEKFRALFTILPGPQKVIEKLQNTKNMEFFKNILVFIFNMFAYENIITVFLHNKLLLAFKTLPDEIQQASLVVRIRNLMYGTCLPLKFFTTNKLDVIDKLTHRFHLINGHWVQEFPFIEILEFRRISTIVSIYVVNCKFNPGDQLLQVPDSEQNDEQCDGFPANDEDQDTMECYLNYGKISPDPYLPKYISHISTYLTDDMCVTHKVKLLAEYVDSLLCGPNEDMSMPQKIHSYKFHLKTLKRKLGTNMIPVGFLRIGFHCERALLFKVMADNVGIPATLNKGRHKVYWNIIPLIIPTEDGGTLERFVVDLMYDIGNLMPWGSSEANYYCKIN